MNKLVLKITLVASLLFGGAVAADKLIETKEVASGFTTMGADPGGGR